MLWSKEGTDSFMDIFARSSSDSSPIERTEEEHDENEDHEFKKRAKRYDIRLEELARERREEGKQLFGEKNYVEAMREFNRSLMFAKPNSEDVGIAYANRSACFFYLNMLKECLADIELAKENNYPKHLMQKLDDRIKKCLELEEESPKPVLLPIREEMLSFDDKLFDEHDQFAGVAECLEIRKNDEFGRHVITNCDLEIGQTILIERPFSITPTKFCTQNRDRCLFCFGKLKNFITCEKCSIGFFCDNYCMKRAFHRIQCGMEIFSDDKEQIELIVNTFLKINSLFSDVGLLMKTVETLVKGDDITDGLSVRQRNFCSVFQLKVNRGNYSDELMKDVESIPSTAFNTIISFPDIKEKYTTREQQCFLQHLILQLFYIVQNAIDLQEYVRPDGKTKLATYSFKNYAKAIYSFGCNIPHSCIPNVHWFSIDDRLVCKVIRPIKKGEQIFRSYL